MKATGSPKALATRLAAVAHDMRETHGDVLAQTIPYACVLRRWDETVDASRLLDGFGDRKALGGVEACLEEVDLAAVRATYSSEGRDAAVYFYEEFLRAYDAAGARSRGVHYSPPEVVSCIIRGVDCILNRSFGCLLDDALVIDPCCGVGTFLRHIEQRTDQRPHMVGLELMPAPFVIASCLLKQAEVRNADWLAQAEIETDGRVPVILGNPPYSGHSSNPGKLAEMMADYRTGLNERNPKWLQDDYVKFIRMAQHQIERAGKGIVAFITNHSYLTNPTFRRMRESLEQTFDEILVLDLHGNVKRHDGRHQNIFPIQMGVAISFFVKTSSRRECSVRYFSIDGTREEKLDTLRALSLTEVSWSEVPAVGLFRLFTPSDNDLAAEFYSFASLFDIFRESTVGFVTSRDRFAIGFTREEVLERILALREGKVSDEELRERYGVGDLDIEAARNELRSDPDWLSKAVEVLYRPFDRRWAYYSRAVMERPRLPFMENLMSENVALAIGRAGSVTGSDQWDVVFCTDHPADLNLFRRGGAKLFPRYVYRKGVKQSNMLMQHPDPDKLFAYIYALLHSTAYRTRYASLLSIDYPRIPTAEDPDLFHALAELGAELLQVHLMKHSSPQPQPSPVSDSISGGNAIAARREGETIHASAGEERATMHIGGYVIPDKVIKDRNGIDTVHEIGMTRAAVDRTTGLRKRIDEIIDRAPPWKRKGAV